MAERLVDEITIVVRAGDGGDGSASFHREKYKPRGGPDGGNGGDGGSVVLFADPRASTLAELRARRTYRASDGGAGASRTRQGAVGDDLRLAVPVGTVVHDAETGELLADLASPGTSYECARGGRGGRGNASIAGGVDRAPSFAERGERGRERRLRLDLRLVADAGLLGMPNAGKSTLLSRLSAARPKVADYPFTTVIPQLGVAEAGEHRFVVADLPGLIEGAAGGRGLGTRFLRHAQRCAVLVFVVDIAGSDPAGDLDAVLAEVESYEPDMAERVGLVVGNKADLAGADGAAARDWAAERGLRFLAVSALSGDGIGELTELLSERVAGERARRPEGRSFAVFRPVEADPVLVAREGSGYRVSSERVERLVAMTPLANPRAVRHLQRRLNALGVEAALEREGAAEGDEVYIGDQTFEYLPTPKRS